MAENESFTAADCIVVRTSKIEIPRCRFADYVKKFAKERTVCAARLFFLNQPIKALIRGVVAVAVKLPSEQKAAVICNGTQGAFENTKEM